MVFVLLLFWLSMRWASFTHCSSTDAFLSEFDVLLYGNNFKQIKNRLDPNQESHLSKLVELNIKLIESNVVLANLTNQNALLQDMLSLFQAGPCLLQTVPLAFFLDEKTQGMLKKDDASVGALKLKKYQLLREGLLFSCLKRGDSKRNVLISSEKISRMLPGKLLLIYRVTSSPSPDTKKMQTLDSTKIITLSFDTMWTGYKGDEKKFIDKAIKDIKSFAQMSKENILASYMQVNLVTKPYFEIALSHIDTSFRVLSLEVAKRLDSEGLQRKVYWQTYRQLWSAICPQGRIWTIQEIITANYMEPNDSTVITECLPSPYTLQRNEFFEENGRIRSAFKFDGQSEMLPETIYKYYILGPFVQDPLTWQDLNPKTNTLRWQSCILDIEHGDIMQAFKYHDFGAKALLSVPEYNLIRGNWTKAYIRHLKQTDRWTVPVSKTQAASARIVQAESRDYFNIQWLPVPLMHTVANLGARFARPVALFDTFDDYSGMLPKAPQSMIMLRPKSAIYQMVCDPEISQQPADYALFHEILIE